MRFFALDSNYMDPKQLAWLEAQLRDAADNEWKIAYFHHALYSSAKYHGSAFDLRKVLEPLFVKYGVDVVVFAGHDHVYERVRPRRGSTTSRKGRRASCVPRNLNVGSPITAKGFDTDRSFMMVEIAGDDLHFQTTSRLGAVVDSGVIHRTIRP